MGEMEKSKDSNCAGILLRVLSTLALSAVLNFVSNFPVQAALVDGANVRTTTNIELGFLKRIYDETDRSSVGLRNSVDHSNRWIERFCELALSQKGDAYARFVRLVRLETSTLPEEQKLRPPGSESLLFFTRDLNRRRVFECLEHDGEAAPADAQYDLYILNRYGWGGRPNYWIRKAAYGGSPAAQVDYASLIGVYLDHRKLEKPADVLEEDLAPQRHYFWVTRAAESNFPLGLYRLARLHREAFDRDWRKPFIDVGRAVTILEKVAAQKEDELSRSSAASDLGELYFVGKQVPQDYARALKWFLQVDEKFYNHCRDPLRYVRDRLVQIYKNGLGVEQNPERVNYYMRNAGVGC